MVLPPREKEKLRQIQMRTLLARLRHPVRTRIARGRSSDPNNRYEALPIPSNFAPYRPTATPLPAPAVESAPSHLIVEATPAAPLRPAEATPPQPPRAEPMVCGLPTAEASGDAPVQPSHTRGVAKGTPPALVAGPTPPRPIAEATPPAPPPPAAEAAPPQPPATEPTAPGLPAGEATGNAPVQPSRARGQKKKAPEEFPTTETAGANPPAPPPRASGKKRKADEG
ncbi:hypothetical protein BOTBODRAFT_42344 [Botryobasidium botryosum FD-172 SS1]|uniref:Uncharacterized protein n=1 Tax=Botryobasidium botryosum (strain FD-172 SS1) TaxID=930990 RepID=A0A067MT18_BOTB1|nr:hypothetical protein BOTBODRAFT_42344 [Botryobasidium botryosum FD-172 SS1]